jgi:hypothetical protein
MIEEPWEAEIGFHIKRGIDDEKARFFVIFRWMWQGDLRPLSAAIWKGHVIDEEVLTLLAMMIDDGRLAVVPGKRGRPREPSKFIRDHVAALLYENGKGSFEWIAEALGTSEQTIRQAVTAHRRRNK